MSRVRPATWSARFYPGTPEGCTRMLDAMLAGVTAPPGPGAIVPHASWVYSGRTAAHGWAAIAAWKPETVVIFGAAHGPSAHVAAVDSADAWDTPLGIVPIDRAFVQALLAREREIMPEADEYIAADPDPHAREHSIEVQLPFVKRLLPQSAFVPIAVRPDTRAAEVGALCAEIAQELGARVALVASTDLTHYGPAFGFEPQGRGWPGIRWAKEVNDRRFVDVIASLNAEEAVAESTIHLNACGPGAVAATIAAMRVLGATQYAELQHTCSADVKAEEDPDPLDSVGYEAGVFCYPTSQTSPS